MGSIVLYVTYMWCVQVAKIELTRMDLFVYLQEPFVVLDPRQQPDR